MSEPKALKSLYGKGFNCLKNEVKSSHSLVENNAPLEYKNKYGYAPNQSTLFENLIDKKQLAKNLSLSLSYIDKLMAQEGLPHFKIGRAVRYRFSEVVTFLERRKRA